MRNYIIGQRIKSLLSENKMMQKELAKEMNLTDNAISYFCSGKRPPNVKQIIQISQLFNVPTDYIFGLTEAQSFDIGIQSVCKCTGLEEEAINILSEHHSNGNADYLRAINEFIKGKYRF